MRQIFKKLKADTAFSMAEVLVVVAIMGILMALASPNVLQIQKSLRQKELDAKAETIYLAVQNEMSKLRSSGNYEKYILIDPKVPGTPSDIFKANTGDLPSEESADPSAVTPATPETSFVFVKKGDAKVDNFMNTAVVEDSLYGNHWIIEYEPSGGNVYAVFYSESLDIDDTVSDDYYLTKWSTYDGLRDNREARIAAGANIGYYGGQNTASTSDTSALKPTIIVDNGEKLVATFQCLAPSRDDDVEFVVTLRDGEGNTATRTIDSHDSRVGVSQLYKYELTLDDLSETNTRFASKISPINGWSFSNSEKKLVPGTKLTINLYAKSDNYLIEPGRAAAETNSLFGDNSTSDTAQIVFGRHLQNLGADSGVSVNIKSAIQTNDINMGSDGSNQKDWYHTYTNKYYNNKVGDLPNFKPIVNSRLESYTGKVVTTGSAVELKTISGLHVYEDTDAGLFGKVSTPLTLDSVTLTGAIIEGGVNAGALIAEVEEGSTDKCSLSNCRVYLSEADTQDKTDNDLWIKGSKAGGLIGHAKAGTVEINDSLASTVINGSTLAGGLVGSVSSGADVTMSRSYADSYIYGPTAAGLACGDISSISACYAAGFLKVSDSSAGLVYGAVSGVSSSYSICRHESATGGNIDSYGTFVSANTDNITALYYNRVSDEKASFGVPIGNETSERLAMYLNTDPDHPFFESNTVDSRAYNLRRQGLGTYTYPGLIVNPHYGDWQAEFRPGYLVYYEKYKDGSYGFEGAQVTSTLNDAGVVVGDGYGVVYGKPADGEQTSDIPEEIYVTINGAQEKIVVADCNASGRCFEVESANDTETNKEYLIYPISSEKVNDVPVAGEFYKKAVITNSKDSHADYYFFNPHFAKTVLETVEFSEDPADDSNKQPAIGEKSYIHIRTPRHLYQLSKYYDTYYRTPTTDATFLQGRDADYAKYEWAEFAGTEGISSQNPIGRTVANSFCANYDGGCYKITNISFVSENDNYVGFIGYNENGTIKNVVMATEFDPNSKKRYLVKRIGEIDTDTIVHIGVLVGYNKGTVDNCAGAGYYIAGEEGTLIAHADSILYAGGLVGSNDGTITNCEVDTPAMRVSGLNTNAYLGGFVGYNTAKGSINNCYDLGFLEIADARGEAGTVRAAGFAGLNQGVINKSYCATSIITNGEAAISYAFSPEGGYVTNCGYLDKGSFFFVERIRDYKSLNTTTAGDPYTYEDMKTAFGTRSEKSHSYYHPNTSEESYPFGMVVSDNYGRPVHYGDWVTNQNLGDLGVFYWEHEEHGSNKGYHISYIGVDNIGTANKVQISGTTLCTAHDDGGVITKFGYGYYMRDGHKNKVSLTSVGISTSTLYNTDAAEAIEDQYSGYVFYPRTTKYSTADADEYVYLDNGEERTGTWTLTHSAYPEDKLEYKLTPFFANAMSIVVEEGSSPLISYATDWRKTDYTKDPGTPDNVYEIRNVAQFKYLNWNCDTHNCDTLVLGKPGEESYGNYKKFPFLQYATVLQKGQQTRKDAEAKRPCQCWVQSHDLKSIDSDEKITPIAGMATSTPADTSKFTSVLFAWFGGSYDGQNYKIQNVNVVSEAYTVGLFGATAGADIKNVIMYANDGKARIERNTENSSDVRIAGESINFKVGPGAYSLGGMIGLAFEYKYTKDANGKISDISAEDLAKRKVSNCAIAGYKVIDRSTNQQGAGTANIGGLIGTANVNLEGCSAVCDITIDCTHEFGQMQFGSHERVGGLAGSAGAPGAKVAVKNCYTGGTIDVSQRTLNESPLDDPNGTASGGFARRDLVLNGVQTGTSNNIYASGVVGGAYAPYIPNFSNADQGSPVFTADIENCYTYITLPALKGTVRAVSLITSKADRYWLNSNITVKNCYYLDGIEKRIGHPSRTDVNTWPAYFFESSRGTHYTEDGKDKTIDKVPTSDEWAEMWSGSENGKKLRDKFANLVISESEFQEMLNGNLNILRKYLDDGNHTAEDNLTAPIAITDEELKKHGAALLNGTEKKVNGEIVKNTEGQAGKAWGYVTTKDLGGSGSTIDGKYSFSSEPAQEGKNYPYPTVVTQKDNTYSTKEKPVYANVHYGKWPLDGWYWKNGRDSMDIFADMNADETSAEKEFVLYYDKAPTTARKVEDFEITEKGDKADIVSVTPSDGCYLVVVKAKEKGTVKIKDTISKAEFVLSITANVTVSVDKPVLTLRQDVGQDVTLSAKSGTRDFSLAKNGEWDIVVEDKNKDGDVDRNQHSPEKNVWTITGRTAGNYTLKVIYTYTYRDVEYSKTTFIKTNSVGYVGLSDGENKKNHQVVSMRQDSGNTVGAYNKNITPTYPDGPELFLFSATGDDLSSFVINSVKVNGNELTKGSDGVYSNASFEVTINEVEEVKTYDIAPIYLRYKDSYTSKANVSIVLAEPTNNDVTYTLSLSDVSVPKYIVKYDGNGKTSGIMHDHGYTEETTIKLPKCEYGRTGYTFVRWKKDDSLYDVGDSYTVNSDATFKASWNANTYKVRFNANGGSGAMNDISATYGDEFDIPAAGNNFSKKNMILIGWNTSPFGTGDGYKDGQKNVKNLTAEPNGVVTLYAQWNYKYFITFMSGGTEVDKQPALGNKFKVTNKPSSTDDWTFEGWYSSADGNAIKVLNADGSVVDGDVTGFVKGGLISLSNDVTLYARWENKKDVFSKTEALEDGGEYVLIADDGEHILNTKGGSLNNNVEIGDTNNVIKNASVVSKRVYSETGVSSAKYIKADEVDTTAIWTAFEVPNSELTGAATIQDKKFPNGIIFYHIRNNNNNKYLRQERKTKDANMLVLSDTLTYSDSGKTYISNRLSWTYQNSRMQSALTLGPDAADDVDLVLGYYTVGSSTGWKANQKADTVTSSGTLYKKQKVHTFDID